MLFAAVAVFLLAVSGILQGRCVEAIENVQLPEGITVHKVVGTWDEADQHCKNEGAVLASPITTEVLNAMKSVIAAQNTEYFIGTKASDFSGEFKSVEGVPLDNMTAAVMLMINKLDPRDGNCLSMNQDSIQIALCCVRKPFMCYKSPAPANKCRTNSEGYTYSKSTGSCYKIHSQDKKNYDDAVATCASEGGHLAVPDDYNEARELKNIFSNEREWYTYIGIHDDTGNGDWRSVTGKSIDQIYHGWRSGHPTGGAPGSKFFCALLLPTSKIDDFECSTQRPFICEIEPTN